MNGACARISRGSFEPSRACRQFDEAHGGSKAVGKTSWHDRHRRGAQDWFFALPHARARYAVEPLGHYGLAKTKYAHFTSPIRRYADLVVHRALFQKSHGSVHSIKETADHISDTERNSADAERDSKDVKLYAFLKGQLKSPNPPRYPGLVIDVRNFGFFVDVSGLAMSGLVPLSTVEDDFYVFDSERSQLVGRRNRRVIRLGDKVEVQVAKVDSFKKQVDFRLAKEAGTQVKRPESTRQASPARPPQQKQRWNRESRPQQKFGRSKNLAAVAAVAGAPSADCR